jgi:Protein involved in formate dehydrogenase formation
MTPATGAERIVSGVDTGPWAARRSRADTLRERYPFGREPLALYRALVDVQEAAWDAAGRDLRPGAGDLDRYVAARVLPKVVEATVAAGPKPLAVMVRGRFGGASAGTGADIIRRWLDGGEQPPVERYLARASASPVLEALGDRAGELCGAPGRRGDNRHCPVCGGLPQCSYIGAPVESLASGPRMLLCSRCAAAWAYPRLTCAACGEQDTAKLTVLAEDGTDERTLSGSTVRGLRGRAGSNDPGKTAPRFPHMRIDACVTCSRYLVSIDLGREPRAVPIVDELAAIPLDLHAVERGFTKVVPNLMGA